MSSSRDFLPDSSSVTYPASTSDSVPPASFVQIQNELTPARSPGSCKVRFSEKNEKCNSSVSQFGDQNRSVTLESNLKNKIETKCSNKSSLPTHQIVQNSVSLIPRKENGFIAGKILFLSFLFFSFEVYIMLTMNNVHIQVNY